MAIKTLYTAVGRFERRTNGCNRSCPIILLGGQEYMADMQEMVIWSISLYSFVFFGNLFANGTSELPTLINPCPASTFVIYESWRSEMLRSFASSILSVDA